MAQVNLPTMYDAKPDTPTEKKVERAVNEGEIVTRKRSVGQKIGDILLNGDVRDVKSYLIEDVLIPAIKETIFDMANKGLDMLLFGGTSRSNSKTSQPLVSYNNYSNHNTRRARSERSRNRLDEIRANGEELIFKERGPAEIVLEKMMVIFEDYHIVTKADLNDILKEEGYRVNTNNFTDHKWGITDMSGAYVDRVRGGYLLRLPRWKHLD